MKRVYLAIEIATFLLIIYQIPRFIEVPTEIIFTMFVFSPFIVIALVYIVLKYGKPSKYTFDERFYDDWDYKRNGKE